MTDLKQCRVLVTPTSYARHDERLRSLLEESVGEVVYNPTSRPLTADELHALLPGCDGYIAGLENIDRAALDCADKLKVISRYGVGVEKVDLDAAREKGIRVTNTPGANASAVAELALGLMLALARSIPHAVHATRSGEWPRYSGIALEGKTVGLLGLGAVGKEVALRAAAFRCRIIAYDPFADAAFAQAHNIELMSRDAVVAQADFLSLHLPVLAETRSMVDAAFLARMKPGSYLINTARGELINDDALYDALVSHHLAGAALDAFTTEPPGVGHKLLSLPHVIGTPHMGAHTDGAINAMGWGALNDLLAVLRGEAPKYPVV